MDPAADVHRRRAGRHGLCGDPGVPARPALDVNEILSSLMLTYVAIQLLYWLMNGPWKDPEGFNFPQTRLFNDCQMLPYISGIGYLERAAGAADRARGLVRDGQDHLRLPDPGGRRGAAGGALRRLQPRPDDLAVAADRRRPGRARRHLRGGRAVRPDGAAVPDRLRLHRDHRRLPRPAASARHRHPRRRSCWRSPTSAARARRPRSACRAPATGVFQAMLLFFLLATDILVRYRLRLRRPRGSRVDEHGDRPSRS